jgi:hypothetical protein
MNYFLSSWSLQGDWDPIAIVATKVFGKGFDKE